MLSENLVSNPGEYRSDNTITKWYDIPREMRELINFMNSRDYRPVERAAFAHYRVVQIQPFPNFNNAVARLIMNFILIRHHYPLTIIKSDDKQDYLDCLSKSNPIYFLQFVTRCVLSASQSCLNRTRECLDLTLPSSWVLIMLNLKDISTAAEQLPCIKIRSCSALSLTANPNPSGKH